MAELKPALSFEEQIKRLKHFHKLNIEDDIYAMNILESINYYRFMGYALNLYSEHNREEFYNDVTFNKIYSLYKFDRELRCILMYGIEIIEICLRTKIAYVLGHKYGSNALYDSSNFTDLKNSNKESSYYDEIIASLQNYFNSKDSPEFVTHYKLNYNSKFPTWVAVELLSFGELINLYFIMFEEDRDEVRKLFNASSPKFRSWLSCILYLRNSCAHHGRIYNKTYPKTPSLKGKYSNYVNSNCKPRLFQYILIMKMMIQNINKDEWEILYFRIKTCINKYKNYINFESINFPENWDNVLSEQ